jgi:hypothetical protein
MSSPVIAMLWEQWRLTRVEAVVRAIVGLAAASAFLLQSTEGATQAFVMLILVHAFPWFSLAKLNGGTFLGGYKPGFPFRLLYTQPVSTTVMVAVAMAYDAVSCTLSYVVSAALVGFAFGESLPVLSVAHWLVAFHLGVTCLLWSSSGKVLAPLGSLALGVVLFVMLQSSVSMPLRVEFSPGKYQLMFGICVLSIVFTIAGVARQRRGGAAAAVQSWPGGFPEWLTNLFRIPCPTSSPRRAQLWFELKCGGFPILVIGLAVAMILILLFAMSIPFEPLRPLALVVSMILVWAVPATLLVAGNAFDIRERQGRMYASAFGLTQPLGSAELAGLKILVRSACVLIALISIVLTIWVASGLIIEWEIWGFSRKGVHMGSKLLEFRNGVEHQFFGQPILISIGILLVVAGRAAFTALRVCHTRGLLVGGSLLLIGAVSMIAIFVAGQKGLASQSAVSAILNAADWVVAIAAAFATIYLCWTGFREHSLTAPYLCGALVLAVAFGAASLHAPNLVSILGTWLLPLSLLLLAPWALSRVRHA